jgi:aspartate aminotransferase-like enzyme
MAFSMKERELLMITGPTNIDPSVLRALSKPPTLHVGPEFVQIFKETLANLKTIFATRSEVFVVAGSGTLALEMAVANVVEPGDKVLNVLAGLFGQYFVKISQAHGAESKVLEVPWGKPVKPEQIEEALSREDFKAVTITHVDTSTSVANPIREIGDMMRKHGNAIYVVDAVCSLGGMEVRMDEWNIDVCACGSQKCLGMPTGLSLVAAGPRALERVQTRKNAVSFWYGDFKNWLPVMREPSNYFATPPVNMIYGLHEALKIVLDEGLEQRFRRHRVIGEAFRAAMEAIGVSLVAERGYNADTVTAAYYPKGIEDSAFRSEMKKQGVIVLSTIGQLKGKGFRVGHMGNVSQGDIMATVAAVEMSLKKLGHSFDFGAGLKAAEQELSRL